MKSYLYFVSNFSKKVKRRQKPIIFGFCENVNDALKTYTNKNEILKIIKEEIKVRRQRAEADPCSYLDDALPMFVFGFDIKINGG